MFLGYLYLRVTVSVVSSYPGDWRFFFTCFELETVLDKLHSLPVLKLASLRGKEKKGLASHRFPLIHPHQDHQLFWVKWQNNLRLQKGWCSDIAGRDFCNVQGIRVASCLVTVNKLCKLCRNWSVAPPPHRYPLVESANTTHAPWHSCTNDRTDPLVSDIMMRLIPTKLLCHKYNCAMVTHSHSLWPRILMDKAIRSSDNGSVPMSQKKNYQVFLHTQEIQSKLRCKIDPGSSCNACPQNYVLQLLTL